MEANNNNNNVNNNNGGEGQARDPLVNVRDRLFHTLFFRLSLAYARAVPKQLRRLLECLLLLKAVLYLLLLLPPLPLLLHSLTSQGSQQTRYFAFFC